jgi:hypothetical protein
MKEDLSINKRKKIAILKQNQSEYSKFEFESKQKYSFDFRTIKRAYFLINTKIKN